MLNIQNCLLLFKTKIIKMAFAVMLSVCVYIAISIPIFLKVYDTSQNVIDEDFHIRQAKTYCERHFDKWDPKITTLPGLYLISYALLPVKFCTTLYLRGISLVASAINIIIIYKIGRHKMFKDTVSVFNAINISILPPLYFFAHLYYTDVISTTAILSLYYCWLKSRHKTAALCGFTAVTIRQTNIIWVVMFLGINTIDEFLRLIKYHNHKRNMNCKEENMEDFMNSIIRLMLSTDFIIFLKNIVLKFWSYILVICAFILFIILNGSIVVGDKSAHVATIHIPQVFYFSLFGIFFGFSVLIKKPSCYYKLISHKIFSSLILLLIIIVIHYNTIEHPYLLADNRHYTFYIWNRFYARYKYFKYAMAPIYLLCMFSIVTSLKHQSFGFQFMYYISTTLVLFLQSLIEIRYFIIPYIILRMNIQTNQIHLLIFEFLHNLLINGITFYIFFNKEILWDDFNYVQRLIW